MPCRTITTGRTSGRAVAITGRSARPRSARIACWTVLRRRLEPRDAVAAAEVRVRVVLGEHLGDRAVPADLVPVADAPHRETSSAMPRAFHQSGVPFGSSRFECRRLQSTWWPYSWTTVCAMPTLRPGRDDHHAAVSLAARVAPGRAAPAALAELVPARRCGSSRARSRPHAPPAGAGPRTTRRRRPRGRRSASCAPRRPAARPRAPRRALRERRRRGRRAPRRRTSVPSPHGTGGRVSPGLSAPSRQGPPQSGATLRHPADVAQLVEHFTRNEGVPGSSPGVGLGKALKRGLSHSCGTCIVLGWATERANTPRRGKLALKRYAPDRRPVSPTHRRRRCGSC